MAQAKIETLTSASVSGNSYVILPRTHTKAIVDDNGTTADDMFNNTVFQGDAEQEVRDIDTNFQQVFTTNEAARQATFNSKEATRDAANQAALDAADTLSGLTEDVADLSQKVGKISGDVETLSGVVETHDEKLSDLEGKVEDISVIGASSTEDELIIEDENGNGVVKVNEEGLFVNEDGYKKVATKDDIATRENALNKKDNLENPNNTDYPTTKAVADAIKKGGIGDLPITKEEGVSFEEEQAWTNDDGTETYASVSSKGIKAKAFMDLDGNPISGVSSRDILYGKKLCVCGDSYSAGAYSGSTEQYTFEDGIYKGLNKVYSRFIALRNNMNLSLLARAGSTITHGIASRNDDFSESTSANNYTMIPTDSDYILIWFGINDTGNDAPIGTISDTVNTTFYGAWNTVLSWIVSNVPHAKVGIVVSNSMNWKHGDDLAEAVRKIADKYGFPTLDLMKDKKIPYFLFQYGHRDESGSTIEWGRTDVDKNVRTARDKVNSVAWGTNNHPTAACHEWESTIVENFLRTL